MTIEARGFREIDARLAALKSRDGTRIIRRALLVAAEPIVEQAKHNVQTQSNRSGSLALSIGARFVIGAKPGLLSLLPDLGRRFAAVIAPLKGNRVATALHNLVYGRRRKNIFHGHFIEFGHRVATSLTGRLRRSQSAVARAVSRGDFSGIGAGSVRAEPFLAPALRARARDAVNIFRAELKDGIDRLLRRRG